MSKILLGIHGLGNKPPAALLEEWWRRSVCDGMRAAGYGNPYYDFELIYWANYIHPVPLDPGTSEADDALFIEDPYVPPLPAEEKKPSDLKKKVLDYIEKQLDKLLLNDDLSINFTAITDLIIKHFFRDLDIYLNSDCMDKQDAKCLAKEAIQEGVLKSLRRHQKHDIILLAHSMGSLIAYDVLLKAPDIKIDTFITFGSPLGVPVLMQKLAAEHNIKISKNSELPTPDNIRRSWINFADIDDRVAFNYSLADDFCPNSYGIRPVDRQVVNNYQYNNIRNPHKSYGYLRTEPMALAIYNALIYGKSKFLLWFDKHFKQTLIKLRHRHAS